MENIYKISDDFVETMEKQIVDDEADTDSDTEELKI